MAKVGCCLISSSKREIFILGIGLVSEGYKMFQQGLFITDLSFHSDCFLFLLMIVVHCNSLLWLFLVKIMKHVV